MTNNSSPRKNRYWSRPGRVAILSFAHRDYSAEEGERRARVVERFVASLGCEVTRTGPITSREQARRVALQALGSHPDAVILFLDTWVEAPVVVAAAREVEHLPLGLWAFGMFDDGSGTKQSSGSFVSLSVLKATLDRMGYAPQWLLGEPSGATAARAEAWLSVCRALRLLRHSALGLVGYASMGMYPGTFDHVQLRRTIGPEVIHIDTLDLVARAEKQPERDVGRWLKSLSSAYRPGSASRRKYLQKTGRLALALEQLIAEHDLQAINVKCQYELSQGYGAIPCVPLSLLPGRGVVAGCEGDVLTTVSQMIATALTRQPSAYGDLIDADDEGLYFSACGFAPVELLAEPPKLEDIGHSGFAGAITSGLFRHGPFTAFRLAEGDGGYFMHVIFGESVPTSLRAGRFPALKLAGAPALQAVMKHVPSQHYALAPGDLRPMLQVLCERLGIRYIDAGGET